MALPWPKPQTPNEISHVNISLCIHSAVHIIQTPGTYQICSNYEFVLNIKCKYNGLSLDNNTCLN